VGICCAKCLGAGDSVVTDLAEVAELIDLNVRLNGVESSAAAVALGWSAPAPPLPSRLIAGPTRTPIDTVRGSAGTCVR